MALMFSLCFVFAKSVCVVCACDSAFNAANISIRCGLSAHYTRAPLCFQSSDDVSATVIIVYVILVSVEFAFCLLLVGNFVAHNEEDIFHGAELNK